MASGAAVTTIFSPVSTHSEPSRTALVDTAWSPASGSVLATATMRAAFGDTFQQRRGGRVVGALQQPARDHDRVDERLDRQRATQFFGDHHDFDWAPADSADRLRERGAEDAQLVGQSAPDIGLPARPELGRGAALLEVVAGGQKLAKAVAQELLFFVQVEVHYSPNVALARMLR